jgi:glyoxylase-like metal-dependent hydrolase (beta-lactamase superfamily II)
MIPVEDNFTDVIGKAQRGLKLSDEDLSRRAGVSVAALHETKSGKVNEQILRKLAGALNLGANALVSLARKEWNPRDPGDIPDFAAFNTAYEDITVNSYLVWDPKMNQGVCFDTGADCGDMLQRAATSGLKIQLILLTHTHPDHIADLVKLKAATEATAFVCKLEAMAGVETFEAGKQFKLGNLVISTRLTSGHARGGITYVVEGLPRRLAVVGDAIFAGSMGGGLISYADALRNNCEQIFTLPEDTILCPGHGPLTTVGEEKQHNPFFPQFQKA